MKPKFVVRWAEWNGEREEYDRHSEMFPSLSIAEQAFRLLCISDDVPQVELLRDTGGERVRLEFKD